VNGWSSWPQVATVASARASGNISKAYALLGPMARAALALGVLAAGVARASDSVSIAISVTVVPVCRFLTSASTFGATATDLGIAFGRARAQPTAGSATLTYSCSSGTAAAFTFAVPTTTNVACAACSGVAAEVGTILATSLGTGLGMGSGHDRTLTVRTPFVHAAYQDTAFGAYSDTIIVTVSP
jgi:hypothetical protein